MAVSIKVVPGETNRVDLKKVERQVLEEKQARLLSEPDSGGDNLLLHKGLEGVVEKYSKISKKISRSTRDEYDMDDDFIDDSEAVDLGEEVDVKEELEQDFYICTEELEEPLSEEGSVSSSAGEGPDSAEDSFSEHSQMPTFQYTYEELCEKLEPIPEDVKNCLLVLKDALESNNLSRRSFTSTYVAPHIKSLFVTAAQHKLAQTASFGENGAIRCSLTEQLWSHVKALFNCKGLTKYRCSKKNFEEEAFSVFYNEWKQMMRNEREKILSDLKRELKCSADIQSNQIALNDSEDTKSHPEDSQVAMNSYNFESADTQTQGSEGTEEDVSASPAKRRKRKAATMAAEEISNLAVHGSTQSPFKKKKLRVDWSKFVDKLVYDYFVKKIAQIRCRDQGKSKKNENSESAAELLNAAFLEYDVTEKDLIDSYRRHKAEIKCSQRQKSEAKREELKKKKELAAQKKLQREQNSSKIQKVQEEIIRGTAKSNEQNHLNSTRQLNAVTDNVHSSVFEVSVLSSEGRDKTMDTQSHMESSKASSSIVCSELDSCKEGDVKESVPLHQSKVHSTKRKLNTKHTPKHLQSSDTTSKCSEGRQKMSEFSKSENVNHENYKRNVHSLVASNSLITPKKHGSENVGQGPQSRKSKPKKQRSRNSFVCLNEKIFKELPSVSKRPITTHRRIPAGFAAEVEAALE